jgi:hypothetical protein
MQIGVDATLVRIWVEHGDTKDFSTPNSKDFLSLLPQYPIIINIEEEKKTKKHVEWKIEIEDNGIGISSDDLKYLMTTGSSSRNKRKRDIIDSMPNWMKPSGTFGIGFQSIFMLTEQVIIETKSFFDEQFQVVELNSPSSQKNGAILIEKKKSNHKKKVGSKIAFIHKTKKIPNTYSLGRDQSLSKKIIESFDPITDDSFNVDIAQLIDKVSLFSTKNYIPLNLTLNDEVLIDMKSNQQNKFHYYSEKNSLEFSLMFDNPLNSWSHKVFYKNQLIDKSHLNSMKFIGFDINILNDDASEVLTIDRNEIRKKYEKKLNKKVNKGIYEYIVNRYDNLFTTDQAKMIASLFLNYYFSKKLKKDGLSFDEWKNYIVEYNKKNKKISLNKLFNSVS